MWIFNLNDCKKRFLEKHCAQMRNYQEPNRKMEEPVIPHDMEEQRKPHRKMEELKESSTELSILKNIHFSFQYVQRPVIKYIAISFEIIYLFFGCMWCCTILDQPPISISIIIVHFR